MRSSRVNVSTSVMPSATCRPRRAAGMRALMALFGYLGEHDQPELWQADDMIHEPAELLGWLNGAAQRT